MKINEKEMIWVEKYRPQLVADLVLPDDVLKKLQSYGATPTNMLFASLTAGTGKTSAVNAIIREFGFETLFINASLDNGIDLLRGKIKQFASTISYNGLPKLVILDEVDNFSDQAQSGLRGFIEEFSVNTRFILTCNYLNKIIPPIINRCELFDFDKIHQDAKSIVPKIIERLKFILENEKVEYEQPQLIQVIQNYYPSIRAMINCLQKSSIDGKLILDIQKDDDFLKIIDLVKAKDFDGIMKYIYNLSNASGFYSFMFKHIRDLQNTNKAQIIMLLAKYQMNDSQVRDKNLNLASCVVELAPYL